MPAPDAFRPGLLQRLAEPPRRVCVLKASRIGDFLCALPAIGALREALPDARLSLVTLPLLHPLAQRLDCVDEVVDFPGFPGVAEQFFDARRTAAFFLRMQVEAFDLAIQLQGSGVYTNPFILMLGARAAAGFVRPGDGPGRLDAALPLPDAGHETERMAALARFLGAPVRDPRPWFPIRAEDRCAAAVLLGEAARPLVGIHPGARDAVRCWPAARFAQVARALTDDFGAGLVVVGEPDDPQPAELVRQLGGRCVDLVGRTGLATLGAVIERLDLLLTTDSGPAHIGYALGTPVLVAFSLEPQRYAPPGPPHRIAAAPPGTVGAVAAAHAADAVEAAAVSGLAGEMLSERLRRGHAGGAGPDARAGGKRK